MTRTARSLATALCCLLLAAACQSPPPPWPTEGSSIKALTAGFSPTGEGEARAMRFALQFGHPEALVSWSVRIAAGSVVVKEFGGFGPELPKELSWDGKTLSGKTWPEGRYYAFLSVDYGEAYAKPQAAWDDFLLVSSPPSVSIAATPEAFTPVGRSMGEPVDLRLEGASEYAEIEAWELSVLDPQGQELRRFAGEGPVGALRWDGSYGEGRYVEPSKTYRLVARVRDRYGNRGESSLALPVKAQPNAPEPSLVKSLGSGFSPTGESSRRQMRFALTFGNKELAGAWTLEILTGNVAVKRFEGRAPEFPAQLAWDGVSGPNSFWPEGEYYPVLTVDYGQAFNPSRAVGEKFVLVSSKPGLRLSAEPPEFTPKGEGMAAPVRLGLVAEPRRAAVASWSIAVLDEKGATVRSFEGTGGAGSAVWDGSLGATAAGAAPASAPPGANYRARAQVRDEYGNVAEASLALPVRQRPPAPEPSLVAAEGRGFSPAVARAAGAEGRSGGAEAAAPGIVLSLSAGNRDEVRAWRLEISDSSGARRAWEGRGAEVPASLTWDGRDDSGRVLPDGNYSARLALDYGRSYLPAEARSKDFLLVATPPRAELSASPEAFTPAENGVSGPLAFKLEASAGPARVASWTLDILDARGQSVRSFEREWPANQVLWDGGLPDGGFVPPASAWTARARVRDEFGNVAEAQRAVLVRDIPLATEPSLVEARSAGFSPAAVGKPRSIDFLVVAGNQAKLKSWRLVISHAERGAQRSFSGAPSALGRSLSWDGKTDSGTTAPDGNYVASLVLDYGSSFKPVTVRSSGFLLHAAPPGASLLLSPGSLKPREGGFERPVEIGLKPASRGVELESYSLSVVDPAGRVVAILGSAAPGAKLRWDGKTSQGSPAEPASVYGLVAELRDALGNVATARANLPVEELPLVPGENAVVPAGAGLSPNGDGIMDSVELRLTVANRAAVRSWRLLVLDAAGKAAASFAGDGAALRDRITWSGRGDSGEPAPEGAYLAELSLDYGTSFRSAKVQSRRFVLSLSPPKGSIRVSPAELVPDEKGLVSPALISVEAASALARLSSWRIDIADAAGRGLASFDSEWPPKPIAWDGVFSDGGLVEPGADYALTATVVDEFGVLGSFQAPLRIGALPAPTEASSVRALARGFSPSVQGSIKVAIEAGHAPLIKRWSLDIEREDRTVRLSYSGEGPGMPEGFTWNGKLQDGTLAPDGRYVARLALDYGRAYSPTRVESEAFILQAERPQARVTVSPELFSPDGDGVAEAVSLGLEALSRYSRLAEWSIDIADPAGNPFKSFRGTWPAGGPLPPLVWDGKNDKGESVESAEAYALTARVRDEFGNQTELKSKVEVDILVVKAGEGFRIRIASIVFKSFTADFTNVPAEQARANVETLNRLAEKLRKYPDYNIRLVGHAVMVNWDDPAAGKAEQEKVLIPLSRARADSIKQALVLRGIEASRMTVEGVGAADQVVPDSDFANRWKNRRVEFFLQRKR